MGGGGGGGRFVWRWFESDISDNTGGHRHSNLVNVFYIIPLLPDIGCFYKAKTILLSNMQLAFVLRKKLLKFVNGSTSSEKWAQYFWWTSVF